MLTLAVPWDNLLSMVLGHFGHGHFGHGSFGQDISATDISAMEKYIHFASADGIQTFTTHQDKYVRSFQAYTIENMRKRKCILFSTLLINVNPLSGQLHFYSPMLLKRKKIYTAAPKKGITVQACTRMHVHMHSHTNIKKSTYQYKFYCPMLLRDNCKN